MDCFLQPQSFCNSFFLKKKKKATSVAQNKTCLKNLPKGLFEPTFAGEGPLPLNHPSASFSFRLIVGLPVYAWLLLAVGNTKYWAILLSLIKPHLAIHALMPTKVWQQIGLPVLSHIFLVFPSLFPAQQCLLICEFPE